MKKITSNNITWIDIQKPTQKKLDNLKNQFNLHPFIVEQFIPPINRPRIEEFPGQLFIILHFPVYNRKIKQNKLVELDIIIVGDTLITSHVQAIPNLESFLMSVNLRIIIKQNDSKVLPIYFSVYLIG